jgi:rhodanese-related sulfurtransferase
MEKVVIFKASVYNLSHCKLGEPMQDTFLFLQNHWMLSTAFVVVLVLLILIEYIRHQRGAKRIGPSQVVQLMNHQEAVLIDIRSNPVFTTGHIVGSISIPMSELDDKRKKLDKYKSKPIILVCATGLESPRAATLLAKYGIAPLILAGGIRGWRDADMPLVKD